MLTLLLPVALPIALRLSVALAPAMADPPSPAAIARADRFFADTRGQAFVVMHRGRVIHESYRNGGAADRRQLLASGSKSFVGVAAIAAAQDKLLRLDAPVSGYLPEWRNDARKSRITIRQLLSLESGMESGNPGTGCGGRGATWNDAIEAGTFAEPGTNFRYGPYPFLVTGAVVERVQQESFEGYLERRVLQPLGVQVEWRARCGDGKPQLAGGAHMTARHWAIFGEMIRNEGVHNGRRVLDASLVRELFRPSASNANYGMSWWLVGATMLPHPVAGGMDGAGASTDGSRRGRLRERLRARRGIGQDSGQGSGRADGRGRGAIGGRANASAGQTPVIPDWMPGDLVMAAGAGDQRLFVIPSRELVVVRMGPLLGRGGYSDAKLLGALFAP